MCLHVWGSEAPATGSFFPCFFLLSAGRRFPLLSEPEGFVERQPRECACLFYAELFTQPDPILRSWNVGGFFQPFIIVEFIVFHRRFKVWQFLSWMQSWIYNMLWRIYVVCVKILCKRLHLGGSVFLRVRALGSLCWQRPRGWHPAAETGQGLKGIIKTRKHTGVNTTKTFPQVLLLH